MQTPYRHRYRYTSVALGDKTARLGFILCVIGKTSIISHCCHSGSESYRIIIAEIKQYRSEEQTQSETNVC